MPFTYQYSQPSEYHFSLDSIQMAEHVATQIKDHKNLESFRVMDLCAGCGVIGFELAWHLRSLKHFEFVEVQDVYRSHFEENKKIVGRADVEWNFHLLNYESLQTEEWKHSVDLVLCNPPYFRLGQGKLSPSEFKNRCRFYIDSDFKNLIESILWVLKPGAEAYLLLRPLQDHAWDMMSELKQLVSARASVAPISNIRGTDLIRIQF
jgi:tRNA1Val (adenine37-N6)-methyltransferase